MGETGGNRMALAAVLATGPAINKGRRFRHAGEQVKQGFLVALVLTGFSFSSEAQTLPVEVRCMKPINGPKFRPLCNQTKQVLKRHPAFHISKRGDRYVIAVTPLKGSFCDGTPALMLAVSYGAIVSAQTNRYPMATAPILVTLPLIDLRTIAEVNVDALAIFVLDFSSKTDELSRFGSLGDFTEEDQDRFHEKLIEPFQEIMEGVDTLTFSQ